MIPLSQDCERSQRVQKALSDSWFQALICSLPKHVLMLTGYWPVVGTSIAVVAKDGLTYLVVPQDEEKLAHKGHADKVLTFQPGSLDNLTSAEEEVRQPLGEVLDEIHLPEGAIGSDIGSHVEPASYAAAHSYGSSLQQLVRELAPDCHLHDAEDLLADLRASLTTPELERVRLACDLANQAFMNGAQQIRSGLTEMQATTFFRATLNMIPTHAEDVGRKDGFFFCMSGPNSALAHAAYAHSRERILQSGDLIMIHCNSYVDGFWTDITRTFLLGQPDRRQKEIYTAIFAARNAALSIIKPGVAAADVDQAARDVLKQHGFAKEFKHQTGHSVGFDAISHTAKPRLHPKSPDVLDVGMVFNIEPAIYIEGYGGVRHCDMAVVTENGADVLTPFQSTLDDLILPERRISAA